MAPDVQAALVVLLAVPFGITSKTADLLNEHGLRLFRHADLAFGIAWGTLGVCLVLVDDGVALLLGATTLYWFLRVKLEYPNHALAGVAVCLAVLARASTTALEFGALLAVFVWLTVSGYANTWLKARYPYPAVQRFLRLRLRYYASGLLLAVLVGDPLPLVAQLAGMLGTEAVTVWHARAIRHQPADAVRH